MQNSRLLKTPGNSTKWEMYRKKSHTYLFYDFNNPIALLTVWSDPRKEINMLCLQVQTTRQQCFYCIVDFIRTCSFTACIDLFLSSYICNHNTTKLFLVGQIKTKLYKQNITVHFSKLKKRFWLLKKLLIN
jgi:hypothetical protein